MSASVRRQPSPRWLCGPTDPTRDPTLDGVHDSSRRGTDHSGEGLGGNLTRDPSLPWSTHSPRRTPPSPRIPRTAPTGSGEGRVYTSRRRPTRRPEPAGEASAWPPFPPPYSQSVSSQDTGATRRERDEVVPGTPATSPVRTATTRTTTATDGTTATADMRLTVFVGGWGPPCVSVPSPTTRGSRGVRGNTSPARRLCRGAAHRAQVAR